ncbi:Rha family transcriptional regulator [Bacillus toyonensis]|uniref:Rha family transcriptional regulator n=1 Tax=Bacillus toyonensis TaxID=155322 RepID=UPI000BF73EBC|nr:Rha family transcriptional regulator [Bacillus toyonensis]PGC94624.1 RsfA family transcription factor [Bacillus toyonensis]
MNGVLSASNEGVITMDKLAVVENTLTSMEVAEMVEKRHRDLLRDIENYIQHMTTGQSANMRSDNYFIESSYQAGTGKNYKCYNITKKGCELIAHKMIGQKGTLFTVTYIERFYEMENHIKTNQLPELSPQLQVLINMEMKQKELEKQVAMIKDELEGKYSLSQPIVADVEEQTTPKVKLKKIVRCNSWSESENELFVSVMLKHIRKGNKPGEAYKEAGRKLRRTPSACQSYWSKKLRLLYVDEVQKARACYINRITK